MRVKSSRGLLALAVATALGSAGLVVTTAPAAVATTDTFSNPTSITINDNASATPYPSAIAVAGVTAPISAVTVTLTGLSHGAMSDIGIVLVAPNGDAIALMDGVGSSGVPVSNVDLTISDKAAAVFSTTTNPTTGTYRPASFGGSFDVFPGVGAYERPATDGTATLTSVFGGDNANGTWNLYVMDFFANDAGAISGGWSLGITTYANSGPISIPAGGAATPYPSTITVAGLTGVVTDVAVTLPGITHANIKDLGAVLVGPTGHAFLVMDGVGGNVPVSNITLTFSDSAASLAPSTGTPVTGVVRPAAYFVDDSFTSPGPGLDYSAPATQGSATFASTYAGRAPNGTWSLYVVDFAAPDGGSISGGWSLRLTTATPTGTTATPTLSSTVPASPSNATTIKVTGSASAGSTVSLYTNGTCSGGAIATGTSAALSGAGIEVEVPANQSTTLFARASKVGETTSACSSTSVTYTHDDVAPAAPTVSAVAPASPGASTTPSVLGTAEAGSTVWLFSTASCTGSPAANGTAAAFASAGIPVAVAPGSTTTFKAKATDVAGNVSGCSPTSVIYTQVTPPTPPVPDTTLTKTPGRKVKTSKKKAKVSFSFSSTVAGATFECSIDGKAFTPCTSGQTFKLKVGGHTFAVRALASGQTDATPATYSFKVKRKR